MLATDPDHSRHKDPVKYLPLHHEHCRRNNSWPNAEGEILMDSRLIYDRKLQHWTFVWVYGKQAVKPCDNQAEDLSVASIDPGVRTFLTWYSPTHGHGKIGDDDINRIIRLCLSLDNLCSKPPMPRPARGTRCREPRLACGAASRISSTRFTRKPRCGSFAPSTRS
ncbi:hypothetical protein BC938DRAFT_478386 [Jimgerdemannia flammicorona]|uniref:Uncharacterized protein n=1 Tax=Jimgerdemannia flammicorona TaxID=994334 RepID=A0A433P5S4_9FUNG|nr:hypothetical protein BC938DRAFT_478386 [Jimgerdemannia flammicorona]